MPTITRGISRVLVCFYGQNMGIDIGAGVMHRMNMQLAKHRSKPLVILLTQILTGEDQQSISGNQLTEN